MNWGLKQGLLGARQQTLSPSLAAVGQNTYLQMTDFLKMVALALVLHALVVFIASIWPQEKVTDIPVRALSFKIGPGGSIAPVYATPVTPQPILKAPAPAASQWRAAPQATVPKPQPVPQPVKPARVVPVEQPPQRQVPLENNVPQPKPQPAPTQAALPDTNILTSYAAIAPTPQRFIREQNNQAGALAVGETTQQVRERYEREISGWIQRHKYYPSAAAGREGRAVVRVRIDRSGNVRYYGIEQSAGNAALDAAAIDMIRRANPMPAVPDSYPAGNLIEFLIPIVFRVPR